MGKGSTVVQAALEQHKPPRQRLPAALHPAQSVVLSFAFVILAGTILLSLPAATRTGNRLPLIDAFFTATSATCVTGLASVDIAKEFSLFGQLVILACIQIGGLGLMTFTTVFLVASGRRLAIADRVAIQESFNHSPSGRLRTLIGYIVVATLCTEAVGAGLLAMHGLETGAARTVGQAIYWGVFHSVSAFCNAGFALYSDNMMGFQHDWLVQGTITFLIIAGGLGFLVGLDIKEYLQQRLLSRYWSGKVRRRVEAIRPRARLSLHTKLVLSMTSALLVIGTVSYYLLERNGVLRDMQLAEAWLNAWFCSVTARTAGFATIDYGKMSGAALLCTMVLMFIGASPGSTGGGEKTSTFALLLTYGFYRWRGHTSPHAFRRSIPQDTIDRAASIVIASVAVIILASSFLIASETRGADSMESQRKLVPVLFETFSAFGTVGLSMGLTPYLTAPGKFGLAVLMFIGRTGPLTLALALSARRQRHHFAYAEENVMVG
jgi:trk system potassium uptake protein TrkH